MAISEGFFPFNIICNKENTFKIQPARRGTRLPTSTFEKQIEKYLKLWTLNHLLVLWKEIWYMVKEMKLLCILIWGLLGCCVSCTLLSFSDPQFLGYFNQCFKYQIRYKHNNILKYKELFKYKEYSLHSLKKKNFHGTKIRLKLKSCIIHVYKL